jgi:5-methylcytosine-specific restriction endonuclease McrA
MKAKKENRKEYQEKYQKEYRKTNKKKLDKYHMYYNFINYEKIKKYNQKYYKDHRKTKEEDNKILEMIRKSRKDRQGYVDIENENRRENQRRYKRNRRLKIYNKYQGRCAYCGKKININTFEIDHLIPKDQESHPSTSENNYINLLPSCKYCNNLKGNHDIKTFREKLFGRKPYKFHFER